MDIRWIEGFEQEGNWTTDYFAARYGTSDGIRSIDSFVAGRLFGRAAQHPTFSFLAGSGEQAWTLGFAANFFFSLTPPNVYSEHKVEFLLAGGSQLQLRQKRVTDSSFRFAILSGGQELAEGKKVLQHNEGWHFIELYADIQDSGSLEFRIDGLTDIQLSNADLQAQSSPGADQIGFHLSGQLDDIYLVAGQDFLGNMAVEGLDPLADSSPNQWSPGGPSASSLHFENIDPSVSDPKMNYLESDVDGQREEFQISRLVDLNTAPLAFEAEVFAQLDVAGAEDMHVDGKPSFTVDSTNLQFHGDVFQQSEIPENLGFEKD